MAEHADCKIIGGALSILGVFLWQRGPAIQIGACVAEGVGNKFAASRTEKKVLIASGASAGLAAAFNAPLAGAMFAMEEVFKYFSPVILLSTLLSAVVADFTSKMIFGISPIFNFDVQGNIPLSGYWLLFILGAMLGVAGAFYNYILIQTQMLYKKMSWLSVKTRPIIPFICAGFLGLVFPSLLCSGHSIISGLDVSNGLRFLLVLLVVKFLFSMLSFGSGAPGGIFSHCLSWGLQWAPL